MTTSITVESICKSCWKLYASQECSSWGEGGYTHRDIRFNCEACDKKEKMNPKQVSRIDEMPKECHWAILKYKVITVPAYEGGTSTEDSLQYTAYFRKEDWEKAILELEERHTKEPYTAMEVKPATITKTVTVGIG